MTHNVQSTEWTATREGGASRQNGDQQGIVRMPEVGQADKARIPSEEGSPGVVLTCEDHRTC